MSSARSVPSASGVCAFAAHEGLAHRPSPVGCRARSVSCGPTANMSSPHGASPGSGLYSPNETSTSSVRKHHERVGDTVGTCSSGAGRLARPDVTHFSYAAPSSRYALRSSMWHQPRPRATPQPAAPLGPVLCQHVAENALGLRELIVVEHIRTIDAEAERPPRTRGNDLAVVEHAVRARAGLVANPDAGAKARNPLRRGVRKLPRRAAQRAVLDVVGDGARQRVEEAPGHRHGCALDPAADQRRRAVDERERLIGAGLAIEARDGERRVLDERGGEEGESGGHGYSIRAVAATAAGGSRTGAKRPPPRYRVLPSSSGPSTCRLNRSVTVAVSPTSGTP